MNRFLGCVIALFVSACLFGAEAKKAGDAVGDVTVKNEAGEDVKLSSFKDKTGVVLFFFPKANTTG